MLVCSLVVILIIFLWRTNSEWEWNVPLRFQTFLQNKKEHLSQGTQRFSYDWKGFDDKELEKSFEFLTREFSGLKKKYQVPFWIEVRLHNTMSLEPRGKYLACLQRRFPDIDIYTAQQSDDIE